MLIISVMRVPQDLSAGLGPGSLCCRFSGRGEEREFSTTLFLIRLIHVNILFTFCICLCRSEEFVGCAPLLCSSLKDWRYSRIIFENILSIFSAMEFNDK